MRSSFASILVVLGLAGCATTPRSVSESDSARIAKVAVVSVLAQELHRGYTGLTVFGNEYEKQDIVPWKIDAEYEAQIAESLRGLGKTVVVSEFDRKDFIHAQLPNGPYEAPAFNTPRWSAVEEAVKRHATKSGADAIVIVVRRISEDFLARTNQSFRGVGYYARGFGDTTRVSVLHAIGFVGLIDGKTGKPLAVTPLQSLEYVSPEIARQKLAPLDSPVGEATRKRLVETVRNDWERILRTLFGR
jgi:hypothetical protein